MQKTKKQQQYIIIVIYKLYQINFNPNFHNTVSQDRDRVKKVKRAPSYRC